MILHLPEILVTRVKAQKEILTVKEMIIERRKRNTKELQTDIEIMNPEEMIEEEIIEKGEERIQEKIEMIEEEKEEMIEEAGEEMREIIEVTEELIIEEEVPEKEGKTLETRELTQEIKEVI